MKKVYVFTAILLTVIYYFSSFQVSAENNSSIQALINEFQDKTKCSSVSAAVYDRGKITYYGDKDSLYQIGSMTKAFTGLAAEKLIQDGVMSETDIVSEFFPGFEVYYNYVKAEITVSELLSQTSGFTNNERDYPSADDNISIEEWVYSLSGKELKSAPGEKYAYSNVNYNILGAIIEKVSGEPYYEYLKREILIPLGLDSTYSGIAADETITVKGTRIGYSHAFDFSLPVKEAKVPAGYLYSNTEDMSRWLEIWINGAALPDSLKECTENIKKHLRNTGDYYSGWELFANENTGHSGGTANYSSRIAFSESKQTGVCVLTNLNAAASTDSLCNSILETVSGENPGGIIIDIWTVFDIVFSALSAVGIMILPLILKAKKRNVLLISCVFMTALFLIIIILFPPIFGADIIDIIFVWAPWSIFGFLLIIISDILVTVFILQKAKKYEYKETNGQGSAADGHNRVPGV